MKQNRTKQKPQQIQGGTRWLFQNNHCTWYGRKSLRKPGMSQARIGTRSLLLSVNKGLEWKLLVAQGQILTKQQCVLQISGILYSSEKTCKPLCKTQMKPHHVQKGNQWNPKRKKLLRSGVSWQWSHITISQEFSAISWLVSWTLWKQELWRFILLPYHVSPPMKPFHTNFGRHAGQALAFTAHPPQHQVCLCRPVGIPSISRRGHTAFTAELLPEPQNILGLKGLTTIIKSSSYRDQPTTMALYTPCSNQLLIEQKLFNLIS